MKTYQFRTETTMKEYNCSKWFIMSDIIPNIEINAETLKDAITEYCKRVMDKHFIEISKTAIKNKQAMYIDTKDGVLQTGYVITGKTDFLDDKKCKYVSQYVDLWVTIKQVCYPEF